MVSCTSVKQTVANHKAKKATKESLETAVKVKFMDGLDLEKANFTVNVLPKKAQELAVRPLITPLNPFTLASRSLSAIEAIRLGKKENFSLYTFIEEWYGTPYRLGGTSKRGIDCSAFVRTLYDHVYGASLLRTAAEQFSSTFRLFSKKDLREGDLVFFSINTRRISHVGVYLGHGNFVHSSSSKGVTISNLDDNYWTRYYAGAGRVSS